MTDFFEIPVGSRQENHQEVKKHYCQQCGKDMGHEWLLGAICGKCVRQNHAKATGGKVKKGRVVYGKK